MLPSVPSVPSSPFRSLETTSARRSRQNSFGKDDASDHANVLSSWEAKMAKAAERLGCSSLTSLTRCQIYTNFITNSHGFMQVMIHRSFCMLVPLCDWNSIEYNSNCQMSIDVDWCRNFVAVGTFGYFRTFPVLKWQLRQLRQIAELAAWLCTKGVVFGPDARQLVWTSTRPGTREIPGLFRCRDLSRSVEISGASVKNQNH